MKCEGYRCQFIVVALIVLVVATQSSAIYSAKPDWFIKIQQIRLMQTNRQQVENLLRNPKTVYTLKGDWEEIVEYELKPGNLTVTYSLGMCSSKGKGFKVEKGTVVELDMLLNKMSRIFDLQLDLSKFEKDEIGDVIGVFTYRNRSTGESFVGTLEELNGFTKEATDDQETAFSCSNQ